MILTTHLFHLTLFLIFQVEAKNGKSAEKCEEYAKLVYVEEFSAAPMVRMLKVATSQCHMEVPLVVGGQTTNVKEFPHMVAIGFGDEESRAKWMCGGSLISEQFVLTAAHCAHSRDSGFAKFAKIGVVNVRDESHDGSQNFKITDRILHPEYVPPSRYNDIALFKLEEPAEMTPYVRPACLNIDTEISTPRAMATGWGKTSYSESEGSDSMMKVGLNIIPSGECNTTYYADVGEKPMEHGVVATQLCAGELKGGKDTCQGDSGGPLQIEMEHPYCMYSIVGVTSFGKLCGFKNSPAIYTRVSEYIPWIESVVWPS